jgi:hypothetical protein
MMIKDKDRTPVAKDLVTRCARCNLELSHVVVVHNLEGVVDRVKCKKENFPKEFERLAEKFKGKESLTYSISGSFKTDDVIDHKTFGMGIVTSVSFQKMEVIFSEGLRLLACDR